MHGYTSTGLTAVVKECTRGTIAECATARWTEIARCSDATASGVDAVLTNQRCPDASNPYEVQPES
ncbi:DUF1962 domain-containing protein [Streptomyces sp. ms191]|nr:DUF1962 domain-containing protein [Streptomyces sp. ms191]